jgi:hypothetical protein
MMWRDSRQSFWRAIERPLVVAAIVVAALGVAPGTAQEGIGFETDATIVRLLQQATARLEPEAGPLPAIDGLREVVSEIEGIDDATSGFALRFTCAIDAPEEDPAGACEITVDSLEGESFFMLSARPDGAWSLRFPDSDTPAGEGDASDSEEAVEVEVFVAGSVGYFALDGVFAVRFDIGPSLRFGRIAAGANHADGQVEVRDLRFWRFTGAATGERETTGFTSAFDLLAAQEPLAEPESGTLTHPESRAAIARREVSLADLAARLTCEAPDGAPETLWDCGIAFRIGPEATEQYRLIVVPNGQWVLLQGVDTLLANGSTPATPGESLTLDLIAIADRGWFAIDGQFVSSFDLVDVLGPGDVAAGSGFFAPTSRPGSAVEYADFTIWEIDEERAQAAMQALATANEPAGLLDPRTGGVVLDAAREVVAGWQPQGGPLSGSLPHDPDSIAVVSSGTQATDLLARVRCAAPEGIGDRLWDCGLFWRADGAAFGRIAVVSDGYWAIQDATGALLAEGAGLPLDGASMLIEVVAVGELSVVAVDGAVVAAVPLPRGQAPGQILAGTAFFAETYLDGGTQPYETFIVWSLDPEALEEIATPAASPVGFDGATPGPVAATPEASPETTPMIQAMDAISVATARLEPAGDEAVVGFAVVSRVARMIDLVVLVARAGEGDTVTLREGACGEDSGNGDRYEVGALDEDGVVRATLEVRLTEILAFGPWSVTVHAADDVERPLACGEIQATRA